MAGVLEPYSDGLVNLDKEIGKNVTPYKFTYLSGECNHSTKI